jgi:hypothetical protein
MHTVNTRLKNPRVLGLACATTATGLGLLYMLAAHAPAIYLVVNGLSLGRRSIQSVGIHLVRLCLFLERGLTPEEANHAMLAAAKHKRQYIWLEPPQFLGALTVADVEAAEGVDEHVAMVRDWASQMWRVWSPHHATSREPDLYRRHSEHFAYKFFVVRRVL